MAVDSLVEEIVSCSRIRCIASFEIDDDFEDLAIFKSKSIPLNLHGLPKNRIN